MKSAGRFFKKSVFHAENFNKKIDFLSQVAKFHGMQEKKNLKNVIPAHLGSVLIIM
jgi:hypothetical protein